LSNGEVSNSELPLAVKVDDLSITYRTTFERRPTLKQALVRFGRGQRAVREVEAIKHISFEVRTGTAMGIIGSNGAGKSTLMRAMAGILPPTSGSIEVWGTGQHSARARRWFQQEPVRSGEHHSRRSGSGALPP
jgi:ABC-type polysaccharide/polyol phosphate transport system ATPase subunit